MAGSKKRILLLFNTGSIKALLKKMSNKLIRIQLKTGTSYFRCKHNSLHRPRWIDWISKSLNISYTKNFLILPKKEQLKLLRKEFSPRTDLTDLVKLWILDSKRILIPTVIRSALCFSQLHRNLLIHLEMEKRRKIKQLHMVKKVTTVSKI